MARVSIVMAVHNGEAYVAEAMESVLRQTYSDLELIVVDDGSDDGTDDVLQKFESSDSRVVVLRPGRIGFAGALNMGIAMRKGTGPRSRMVLENLAIQRGRVLWQW